MAISLSLSAYTRTSPDPQGWRRRRVAAREHRCALRTEHHMVYESTDGRVFEVRRLRCDGCGRRWRDVTEREVTFAPPRLRDRSMAVEANF